MAATLREFTLTPETAKDRITVLLAAFGYVPPQGRPRTIEIYEVEAALKGKLFAVTKEPEGQPGFRVYSGGDQTLSLTPGEIELLRARILEQPNWSPFQSDAVADTYRWLGLSGS